MNSFLLKSLPATPLLGWTTSKESLRTILVHPQSSFGTAKASTIQSRLSQSFSPDTLTSWAADLSAVELRLLQTRSRGKSRFMPNSEKNPLEQFPWETREEWKIRTFFYRYHRNGKWLSQDLKKEAYQLMYSGPDIFILDDLEPPKEPSKTAEWKRKGPPKSQKRSTPSPLFLSLARRSR